MPTSRNASPVTGVRGSPGFRSAPDMHAHGFGFGAPVFFPGGGLGRGPDTAWDVKVSGSGHPKEVYWKLDKTAHWYDFVVTSDSDPSFNRRFAGHVETGHASVSDPGMALADKF